MSNDGYDRDAQKPRPKSQKSGNRRSRSAFDEIDSRKFAIELGGKPRKVDADVALRVQNVKDAFAGKLKAVRLVLKWILEREVTLRPEQSTLPIFVFLNTRPRDVDRALILLGLAFQKGDLQHSGDRPYLELEPRIVARALRRSAGRKLGPKALRQIAEQTRDAHDVEWPGDEQ